MKLCASGASGCGLQPIGFVLPDSAQPGDGRDGGPRIASSAATGFVLPNAAQPGDGRDGGPRIPPPPGGGDGLACIEGLDGGLSP
jgi:hypothetical protein